MVKSQRQKDLRSVDPGNFVLLNSPASDRREILKVTPPIIQSPWASILLPLGQANDICTNQPASQPASGITVHIAVGENWGARDPHTLGEASFSLFFLEKN